jgi:hypothetical protein
MMDFDQVELAIEEGYIGVKEKMEDIKALLEIPGIDETEKTRNLTQRHV